MAEFTVVPMRNGRRAIKHIESGEVLDYLTPEQEAAGTVKVGDETITFPKLGQLQKTHDIVTGITGPSGAKKPEVKETSMLNDLWEFGKEYYAPLLTTAGSIGGGIVGSAAGPLGTIAGGAAGAGLGSLMASYGQGEEDTKKVLSEALTGAGINAAIDAGTLGAGKVLGAMKRPLGRMLTPVAKELSDDVWMFVQQHPQLKATAAQLRQSRLGNFIENIIEFGTKKDMAAEQQQLFREAAKGYTNDLGPEKAAGFLKDTVMEGFNKKRAQIKSIWTDLKSTARQTQFFGVEAPIDISTSKQAARELLEGIKRRGGVDDAFKGAVDEMERFVRSTDVISLEEALALKQLTGVQGFRNYLDTIETGAFKKLNRAMNNDISNSFLDPKFNYSNPTELVKKYTEGNAATRTLHEVYEDIPEVNRLLNTPASGKNEMSAILRDGAKIDALLKGASDPVRAQQTLKEEFLKEVFQKAGIQKDQFTKEKILEELISPSNRHAIEKLFPNKTELANLMRLAKTIKHFDPNVPSAGAAALVFHGLGLGGAVAGGLALNSLANKDFVSSGVAVPALSLGLFLSGATLTRKLLLNPENARLIADLAKLPKKSAAAQAKTTKLLQSLKLTQVPLVGPDGVFAGEATINKDGKIILPETEQRKSLKQ